MSFEIVGIIWHLKPVIAHDSCITHIAGFGEIGENRFWISLVYVPHCINAIANSAAAVFFKWEILSLVN